MTVDDATKVGALFATVITSLLGYLTWLTTARKSSAETTEQRVAREDAEQAARAQRLDDGVWRMMEKLEEDVARLNARVTETDALIATLREENINVRGDLALAKYTIGRLEAENQRLTARISELERIGEHDGGC